MKRIPALLLALLLALALPSGCASQADDGKLHVLCTTYPVYLFTTAVIGARPDVETELLVNQQTSCLHDYTLTVEDMKTIHRADVIVISGAGLEEFLDDALAHQDVPVIDCSQGLRLLPDRESADRDGRDETYDPHFWLDPVRARSMLDNIAAGLEETLGAAGRQGEFLDVCLGAQEALDSRLRRWRDTLASDSSPPLITFHDGFAYFADAFDLELLKAVEEEEGAEAGAKELEEIVRLVRARRIPAIFVEKNGSRRSADVIARETGCKVYELDMMMSGEGTGMEPYLEAMDHNLETLLEAFG